MSKKASEHKILSLFDNLKHEIKEHEKMHGGSIWDKLADKAIDKGFDIAEKKLFGGAVKPVIGGEKTIPPFLKREILKGVKAHASGGGFDDATVRPIMKEIGTYLNPLTLVELMGGRIGGKGLEDANPLLWGYMLGHDVIGPAIFGRGAGDMNTKINKFFYEDMPSAFTGRGRGRPKKVKEPEDTIHIDIDSHNASSKGKSGMGFKKGSQEAKEWGQKMREARMRKSGKGLYA